MQRKLILLILTLQTVSVLPAGANEFSKIPIYSEIKSRPICKFVHDFAQDWNNCFGLYDYKRGSQYLGDWMHDEPDGWGIQINGDSGRFHLGQFQDGLAHGYGLSGYHFGQGSIYVGIFKNGIRNGWFNVWHSSGSKHKGQYIDDERHGMWLEIDINGDESWYEYDKGRQIFPPRLFEAPDRMLH